VYRHGDHGIAPTWRRFLEGLGIIDAQTLKSSFLASQSEQVKEHQPQALAGARAVGASRPLEQGANRALLAIRIKHGGLFRLGVDRVQLGLDLKFRRGLTKLKLAEIQWLSFGLGNRRSEGEVSRYQADWHRGNRFLFRCRTKGSAPLVTCTGNGGWPGNHFLFRRRLLEKRKNHMGQPTEAMAVFSALSEDYPELPEPYNNLAVVYAQQKQYEKARTALEMAIRTDPGYALARENLGDVYARLASQAYDQALQLDPSNKVTQSKLSRLREPGSSVSVSPGKQADAARPSSGTGKTGAAAQARGTAATPAGAAAAKPVDKVSAAAAPAAQARSPGCRGQETMPPRPPQP
jgi:tetratricopeptide (TPR) repeat protein